MITSEKLVPKLEEAGIDAIVASTNPHVFYTTGMVPSTTVTPHEENFEQTGYYYDSPPSPPKCFSVWTVDEGGPYMVIPPVETTQIADSPADPVRTYVYSPGEYTIDESPDMDEGDLAVLEALGNNYDDIFEALGAAMDDLVDPSDTVAFERMSLSNAVWDHVEGVLPTDDVEEATTVFHELRMTKTDEEIRRLRTASEIHENAIEESLDELEEGMTETEFADIFRQKQCRQGAKPWHTMIGFGSHSAYSHANPGDRELEAGDVIRFEVGIEYEHYPADLARTYAFKSAPETAKRRYDAIYAAMETAEELMAHGESTTDVHNGAMDAARATAKEVGADELVGWTRRHIGHNMGIDMHDHPLLAPSMAELGDDELRAGMVMNYELAHLTLGNFGVQLEDTGVVTENGFEPFTGAPETLQVID